MSENQDIEANDSNLASEVSNQNPRLIKLLKWLFLLLKIWGLIILIVFILDTIDLALENFSYHDHDQIGKREFGKRFFLIIPTFSYKKEEFDLITQSFEKHVIVRDDLNNLEEVGGYLKKILTNVVKSADYSRSINFEINCIENPAFYSRYNALSFPNGKIYIEISLLKKFDNEAQLVGMVAHEVGHVVGRHSEKFSSRATTGIFIFPYIFLMHIFSPVFDDEVWADTLAVQYLAKLGYCPEESGFSLAKTIEDHERYFDPNLIYYMEKRFDFMAEEISHLRSGGVVDLKNCKKFIIYSEDQFVSFKNELPDVPPKIMMRPRKNKELRNGRKKR